jgi:hypothetical protein
LSEAAVLSAQKDERIGAYVQRLASKLGKAKAYSALAHKLGRAFYHMLLAACSLQRRHSRRGTGGAEHAASNPVELNRGPTAGSYEAGMGRALFSTSVYAAVAAGCKRLPD